jgi:hypothetical protein
MLSARHIDDQALAADAAVRGWESEGNRHRRLAENTPMRDQRLRGQAMIQCTDP